MSKSTNLTKRLKKIEDIIDPPAIKKKCTVIKTGEGYICDDLKIINPSKKEIINSALKKASKKRELYIVVLDLCEMDDENSSS